MRSKVKSLKNVITAPVDLFRNIGDAILSISKQESDEQTAKLKADNAKSPRTRDVIASRRSPV